MNKTLYLREDEVPIWERARELSADKLSPVIVAALKRYVTEKEAQSASFHRIQVEFNDADDHWVPKAKAFYGRWLIPPDEKWGVLEDFETEEGSETGKRCTAVALTAKGAAAFLQWNTSRSRGRFYERFKVYQSLERAASDPGVNFAALEAIKRRGIPVEELDI